MRKPTENGLASMNTPRACSIWKVSRALWPSASTTWSARSCSPEASVTPRMAWSAQVGKGGGFSFRPDIADGRVYTLGGEGRHRLLVAFELDSGAPLWSIDLEDVPHDGGRRGELVFGDLERRVATTDGFTLCPNAHDHLPERLHRQVDPGPVIRDGDRESGRGEERELEHVVPDVTDVLEREAVHGAHLRARVLLELGAQGAVVQGAAHLRGHHLLGAEERRLLGRREV